MDFLKKKNKQEAHPEVRPVTTSPDGLICIEFLLHVEQIGDIRSGTDQHVLSFPGKRVEGFQILSTIPEVEFKYRGHVQDVGDTEWSSGNYVGSRGRGRRLEGIAVKLEGAGAEVYDVRYYVQMHGVEKSRVCVNGEFAGTHGESRRVEGVAIWLEPKKHRILHKDVEEIPYTSWSINAAEECEDLDGQYTLKRLIGSDINEHIPTLYEYARECTAIAEFGVRGVVTTWAFLRGLRDSKKLGIKKLYCVDLKKSDNIQYAESAAGKNNITLEFKKGNDLSVSLKQGVDLLFIDTWHVYAQLKLELEIHAWNVRKYIILHDTAIDGEKGEAVRAHQNVAALAKETGFSEGDIKKGLGKAIQEFLANYPNWKVREVFTNNNGLTILERVGPNPDQ
eukprot:Phypoly_transcript_10629.p1 GENE.Phypoly_transcript_10629~~Phypoly_transcript_10629.p1  ORF type:complete len:412 (+),score=85.86 Phypoly_transcript_10629:60-1238(+)